MKNTKTIYRDGLEERVIGTIKIGHTREGHTVEKYKIENGQTRYFVTLSGTHWCAHGDTVAQAVADAIWKDPAQRPSLEALAEEIRQAGRNRKINLNEFRLLTGACLAGCKSALRQAGRDETPLTAFEIRDLISREWGNKLIAVLGWGK